jgi:ABC-2 type transport system ATP-binding protein
VIEGVVVESNAGRRLQLRIANESCLPEIVRLLIENGANIYSVIPQRVSLEDLFLEMMGPDPGL